jgi:hypothetical protein
MLKNIVWYTDRQLSEISLGGLIILVIIRTIQFNMSRTRVIIESFNFDDNNLKLTLIYSMSLGPIFAHKPLCNFGQYVQSFQTFESLCLSTSGQSL